MARVLTALAVLIGVHLWFALPAFAAFPTVAATSTSTSTGTAQTVTLPTGIASGDLLVCFVGTGGQPTATWPGGWSEIFDVQSGATVSHTAGYRIADGTEGASITVTLSASNTGQHLCYRINNWHGTTPPEGSGVGGASTSPNPPSNTPSWGAADTLWLASLTHDSTTNPTAPTNYTNLFELDATGTTASARRELNAASEDPGTFTVSPSDDWIASTIAVRPAAGGAAPAVPRRPPVITLRDDPEHGRRVITK